MNDWALKYRPKRLVDLEGQDVNREILQSLIEQDKLFNTMIFYGKSGCGKTTTARILQHEMDAETIELDAASNNGVDDARNIRDIATKMALTRRRKIIIIDEAHMLSRQAWNALLKVIEEPNPMTHFIFCTTEYEAIPDTIKGRSQLFKFYGFTHEQLKEYSHKILAQEGKTMEDECLDLVIKESKGQIRDLLKRLQVVTEQKLTSTTAIRKFLGIPSTRGMGAYLDSVLKGDSRAAVRALKQVAEECDLIDWKNRLETLIYEILEDAFQLTELPYTLSQNTRLRSLASSYPIHLFGNVLDFTLRINRADTAYKLLYVLAVLGAENVN